MSKTVLITSDAIGDSGELGALLLKNFLYALARNDVPPARVLLMNTAVRLACTGSDSIGDLALLADAGAPVKACGTCLDYLGLRDSLEVGEIGTMPGSVEAMLSDDAVVTIR